jgi:hypothetical protein
MRVPLRSFLLVAFGAGVAGYLRFGRPRVLNWGATDEEVARRMAGDEIVPDVSLQTTRAIAIEAGPEHIWPWLVQMGPRPRAGAYTYDWVERLLGIDIVNSDRILPQFQHLDAGEYMPLDSKGNGITAREVQPERHLVLQWVPAGSTWSFGLYAEPGGRTRLVSRNRIKGKGPMFWLGMVGFMEAGSSVMERKMLLGIKERAERLTRSGVASQTAPPA